MPVWSYTPPAAAPSVADDEKKETHNAKQALARKRRVEQALARKRRVEQAERWRAEMEAIRKAEAAMREEERMRKDLLANLPRWRCIAEDQVKAIKLLLALPFLKHLSADSLEIVVEYLFAVGHDLCNLLSILDHGGRIFTADGVCYPTGKLKKLRPYVLEYLALRYFKKNTRFKESTVNKIIKKRLEIPWGSHVDISTARRQMVEMGLLRRTPDCEEYWIPRRIELATREWHYF